MVTKQIHIIGAGCAGLSLAKYIKMGTHHDPFEINFYGKKTKAFEKPNYWSFWRNSSNSKFDHLVKKKWFKWQIISNEARVIHKTSNFPYCTINSRDWLNFCGFEEIDIKADIPKPGSLVFDSRTPKSQSGILIQEFIGQTVVSQEAIFDPNIATLMDFRCEQSKGIHFIYLLPFSSNEALVESTRISQFLCPKEFYKKQISTYLNTILHCSDFKIITEEYGKIPMGTLSKFDNNYLGIGANGGCLRKSSGYAFNAILRQSQKITEKIFNNQPINSQKQISNSFSIFEEILDSIFLMALIKQPQQAPEYFTKISARLKGSEFAQFMSGGTSLIILLKLIFSLPKIAFIKAFFYTIKGYLKSGNNNR